MIQLSEASLQVVTTRRFCTWTESVGVLNPIALAAVYADAGIPLQANFGQAL